MNIWNKVFLGVIIVTAIGVVALASVERKIRGTGQHHLDSLQQKIAKATDDIARITDGTAPTKSRMDKSPSEWGIEELRNVLRERYYERGRAWFGCIVSDMGERVLPPVPPGVPQVITQVIITGPLILGESGVPTEVVIPEHLKGTVYIFAEPNEGNAGAFLGRFNVDSEPVPVPFRDAEGNQMNGYRVTLITADPVNEVEIEQIFEAAKSRWAIYLTPPIDRFAGIFDQLTAEEKQIFPQELLERFQSRPMPELTDAEREGVSSEVLEKWITLRQQMDDPEAEGAEDFVAALDWLYQRRSSFLRDIEVAQSEIATYKTIEEQTNAENEQLKAEGVFEEKCAERMSLQRDAVKVQWEQCQEEIKRIELQIEKLQTLNEAYVAKIAEYQAKAVEAMETQAANGGQIGDGAGK